MTAGHETSRFYRLPAPGMVDQEFRVDAEGPVKDVLAFLGHPGDIAHRVHTHRFQPRGIPVSHAPEVGQRQSL